MLHMRGYRRRKRRRRHVAVWTRATYAERERAGIRREGNELDPAVLYAKQRLNLEQYRGNACFDRR